MNKYQKYLLIFFTFISFFGGLYNTTDQSKTLSDVISFYLIIGVPGLLIYFLLSGKQKVKLQLSDPSDRDPEFEDAVRIVAQHDKASTSLLQRRLQIGFNKAARLLEQLEDAGVISPADGAKPRDVLIDSAEEYFNKNK